MNIALIAKIGWRVLHDISSLLVQVVRKKYKVGLIQDQSWMVAKSNWSSTWRSVGIGIREVVYPGYSWVIGDGRQIRFWRDKWLSSTPLLDEVIGDLQEGYESQMAHDLWNDGAGWDLQRISPYVTKVKRLELASIVLDRVTGAKDRVS